MVHNEHWNCAILPTISMITIIYTVDCGVPVSNAMLNYSSTLEGSVLILTCENDISTDEQTLNVTCHSNGSWTPDPVDFTCSDHESLLNFTTVPPGIYVL